MRDFRVHVEADYRFALDQLNMYVIARDGNGGRAIVQPTELVFNTLAEGTHLTEPQSPSFQIPNELAEALLGALVPHFIGTDPANLLQEVRKLRSERDFLRHQLNNLISGIGRLGAPARG